MRTGFTKLQRLRVWRWHFAGRSIAFTNGCFDLFHPGHQNLIEAARSCCSKVVVAINTDESVRRLKGSDRPLQPLIVRMTVLRLFADLIVPFDGDEELLDLVRFVRPTVLIKGDDWRGRIVVGAHLAQQVLFTPLMGRWSTTRLVANME